MLAERVKITETARQTNLIQHGNQEIVLSAFEPLFLKSQTPAISLPQLWLLYYIVFSVIIKYDRGILATVCVCREGQGHSAAGKPNPIWRRRD